MRKIATLLLKVLHFLGNLLLKSATFSINYLKLKIFKQLLQSQPIVANILVSLDSLYLLRILNFLYIF